MVADFLDLENKIKRRFREDSVTDIIIASLLRIAGGNATVLVPPEVKTGGDFDILILEPATGDAIQYRIQAKRLSPHPTNWTWGSYRELDHPHGAGGQSSTLIRSSAQEKIHTIPLYAFYNPETACKASGGDISGIEMADGREINQIVKTLVKAKAGSKRPRLKRVGNLRDLFFPLSTILCPPVGDPTASRAIIPPRLSRRSVEVAIADRVRPAWMWEEQVPRLRGGGRLALPPSGHEADESPVDERTHVAARPSFSRLIERVIERGPEQDAIQVARVKRPRVLLVSRSSEG